jgi:ATP-grasp domain, R2K clade family 3
MNIVLQNLGDTESRAVRMAGMLADDIKVTNASIDSIQDHQSILRMGAVPVGSVQFVRRAMELTGIPEPKNLSYPPGCEPYIKRKIWKSTAGQALNMTGRRFIKSCETKAFTGFVLDSGVGEMSLDDHDQDQYNALRELISDDFVWVSEPVQWLSEYRYYVSSGSIVGHARYDQQDTEFAPEPSMMEVKQCINDLAIAHPYALDMGVLASGETALVEVNDAWAIGLYGGALNPRDYVLFLTQRWASLRK